MTVYRRIVLDVAADDYGDPNNVELLPAILTTLGAIETAFIGGTGIQIINMDERPLELIEAAPEPANGPDDGFTFPETFQSEAGSGSSSIEC